MPLTIDHLAVLWKSNDDPEEVFDALFAAMKSLPPRASMVFASKKLGTAHTRAIAERLAVPVSFEMSSQQKRDETKPTTGTTRHSPLWPNPAAENGTAKIYAGN